MKKIFSLFTIVILSALSLKATQLAEKEGFKIECNINGLEDGLKIQLGYHSGETKRLQDTAFVDNNKFVFARKKSLPRGVYLVIIPEKGYFDLIIGDDQYFSLTANKDDFVNTMKFKGSQENTDFYQLLKKSQPLKIQIQEKTKKFTADSCTKEMTSSCKTLKKEVLKLKEEVKDIEEKYIANNPNYLSSKMVKILHEVFVPDFKEVQDEDKRKEKRYFYYKKHFLDNVDFGETGLVRSPVLIGKVDQYFDQVVQKSCDSTNADVNRILSYADSKTMYQTLLIHLATKYQKSKIMCFDCVKLNIFENHYLKDERVDWISEEQKKSIQEDVWKTEYNQCGDKAYPLEMADTNGVVHNLHDIKADYTIVYFFSATCGHCKKATPKLKTMYDEIKDTYNVEVFAVSIDRERGEYDKFLKKGMYSWINVIDTENKYTKYRTAYNVFSTPTIYILDKDKKIIAKKLDVEALQDFIEKHDKLEK